MSNIHHTTLSRSGLTLTAYRDEGSALLGFDLDEHLTKNFAGFAGPMTAPGCPPVYLKNRLSFDKPLQLGLNRDNWRQDYYNPRSPKYTERLLFVK